MLHPRRRVLALAAATAAAPLSRAARADWQPSTRYPDPAIQILDPSFARYRLALAKVERLATGFRWTEGPVWFGDGRFVLFSDIPNNRIMKWEEETGAVSLFRKPANFSNGNTRDRQGRLLTCEHGTRRITRTEYDGTVTVVADRFEGKPLNSPNDVVCKSDGSIWFTDPPFGILGYYEGYVAKPELPTNVYRVDGKTGKLTVVAADINRPNGLTFSPDEAKLYVVEAGTTPRIIHVVRRGRRRHPPEQQAQADRRRPGHAGRPALRRRRQPLGRLGDGAGGPRRRGGLLPRRQADRPHQPARTLRQPLLRRPPPQPPVPVRQHRHLLAVHQHPGRDPPGRTA